MISLLSKLSDDEPNEPEDRLEWEKHDSFINELLMLLSSRPKAGDLNDNEILRHSVINYGIYDHFPGDLTPGDRHQLIIQRVAEALHIFEPRLSNVSITLTDAAASETIFVLEAECHDRPIRYLLEWDDAMSQFYLRE